MPGGCGASTDGWVWGRLPCECDGVVGASSTGEGEHCRVRALPGECGGEALPVSVRARTAGVGG